MIPKPLNDIEWSDIEALRDSGREEDDTIEYKASFSGGDDFLAFNDSQRTKAVMGVVREALAFLNGRGGDVVIGVREAKNDHPKIEEITPVANVNATVDRLAQSLAAVIEPTQSILGLKAILKAEGAGEGVIIVRAPSSLRAPHRYTANKECYIRRGRESVPMPMDEIQDLTLNRTMRRNEQQELLTRQFAELREGRIFGNVLPSTIVHLKMAYLPFGSVQLDLVDPVLTKLSPRTPTVHCGTHNVTNDIAYRNLDHRWRPTLRGRQKTHFEEVLTGFPFKVQAAGKTIGSNGLVQFEFAVSWAFEENGQKQLSVPWVWILGFLADSLESLFSLRSAISTAAHGTLRVEVSCRGDMSLLLGERWRDFFLLRNGLWAIPDFELEKDTRRDEVFHQLQRDLFSIANAEPPQVWSLEPSK
jgi:hypothetical protein